MATYSRIKTWVSNEVLTASDLNAEFDNILTNDTPSGVEDASADVSAMQSTVDPGGVGTESLATSLLGELQRLRFVIKRIVGAQWYTDPARYLTTGNLGVQTADIAASAVTTAKIAAGNVTRAKLEAVGQQISSSSGTFSTANTTATDITNLSASITTTGRMVRMSLIPDGAGSTSYVSGNSSTATVYLTLVRDASPIAIFQFSGSAAVSAISFYDPVAAGTYTYKLQIQRDAVTATTAYVYYAKLVVYEL